MAPRYPLYDTQPNQGKLPCMKAIGPPDMRPTSSTAFSYQKRLDAAHGRWLAGLGSTEMKDNGDRGMEPAYAYNELKVAAEMDDVEGNGIFDPTGAQKNIHPQAGVFATNYSLPGYHAREIPFSLSEERDATTGRPVRAVPSGAVANDSSAQIAFFEKGLYKRPEPLYNRMDDPTQFAPTWNVMQNPMPVGNTPESGSKFAAVALVGLGALLLLNEARKVGA